jgi:WD40 repeat protein
MRITGLVLVLASVAAYGSPPGEPNAKVDHALPASGALGITFSNAGDRLLTAGPRSAIVWGAKTERELVILRPAEDHVFSQASLSRDGRTVLTASGREAATWSVGTGKLLRAFRHDGAVHRAQLSPDGRLVLTSTSDGVVTVWDAEKGAAVRSRKFPGFVYSAEFSPDGKRIFSISGAPPDDFRPLYRVTKDGGKGEGPDAHNEAEVHLWEVATGTDVVRPRNVFRRYDPASETGLEPWLRPAALSPDGTRRAYFNVPEGLAIQRTFDGRGAYVGLIQASYDDELQPGGRLGTGWLTWVEFASNDELLIAGGTGRRAVISVPKERIVREFDIEADAIDPSPDGHLAVARSSKGVLAVFEISSARKLLELRGPAPGMPVVAFHPDSAHVAICFPSELSTRIFSIPTEAKRKDER